MKKKNLPVLLYIRKGYLVSSKIKILKTGSNPSPHFSLFFCDQNVILHDGLITSILDYYIKKQVINIENLALVLQVGIWACALPVFAKAEHVCATPMKLVDRKKKRKRKTRTHIVCYITINPNTSLTPILRAVLASFGIISILTRVYWRVVPEFVSYKYTHAL